MKKVFLFNLLLILFLTNCGPSAEEMSNEQARFDELKADSISKTATLAENIDLNTSTPNDKKFIKTAELKFKVNNVLFSTQKIEDFTIKYGGYLTFSNLQNSDQKYNTSRISRDSILISKQIVVVNEIKIRIPNEKLDSFIRELNMLVVFFDYRVIKLDEVTLQFVANQKKTERLEKYEKRQEKHIDTKDSKLKETTNAEETLLDKQNQADDLKINQMALEDQVKYCNLTIEIYQKPIVVKEVIADFGYVSEAKPNFFKRILDSLAEGWSILEEIILFFVQIWGIIVLGIIGFFAVKYLSKLYKKIK